MHKRLQWSNFRWEGFELGEKAFPKAVLLLPICLDGVEETFWMQLDTGTPGTVLYEHQVKNLLGENMFETGMDSLRLSGYYGGFRFEGFDFEIMKDYGSDYHDTKRLGTIGLDLLIGRMLFLDYPNERFCICDASNEIDISGKKVHYKPVRIVNKALMFDVKIDETSLANVMFDTGSSLFELTVSKELWQTINDRTGDEKDNFILEVSGWNEVFKMVGTPLRGNLVVLNKEFVNPLIYYVSRRDYFPKWLDGIMGNALFFDRYMLIIDLINNRCGLVES